METNYQSNVHVSESASTPSSSQIIPSLTGLRAVAAGMVFFGHMFTRHFDVVPDVLHYGWTGVDVFFALSGFLFTIQYADTLIAGTFSLSSYIKRRIIRIYPVTSLVVLVSAASTWWAFDWRNVLYHVTLVHGWIPWYRMRMNAPMWTLTVEEAFYFMAPLLILYVTLFRIDFEKRLQKVGSLKLRATIAALVMLLIWFMSLVLSRGATAVYNDLLCFSTGLWDDGVATHTIIGRIGDFVVGMLAAALARMMRPRNPARGDLIVALGIGMYIVISLWVASQGGPNLAGNHKLGSIMLRSFALAAAVVIYGLYVGGWCSRLLSTPLALRLGECSFTLYLIQYVALYHSQKAAIDLQYTLEAWGLHFVPAALLNYCFMNLVATAIFLGFEKPVSRYLRARFIAPTNARSLAAS